MKNPHLFLVFLASAIWHAASACLWAETLLTTGDPIIAIDSIGSPESGYPQVPDPIIGESAENVLDGDSSTKYLNFGKEFSGFIVTPGSGSSVVQSLTFVSANDFDARDPINFVLYGTNEEILSTDYSRGDSESWTEIAVAAIDLPTDRFTASPPVEITNSVAYTSYRLVFDLLRDSATANSMQIADVAFFDAPGATGASILAVGDPIIAVDLDTPLSESPARILDGDSSTKYLNVGGVNSGFIVTPSIGSSMVQSIMFVSADDAEERDPASFVLFGTNEAIASVDNGLGDGETWVEIGRGAIALPADRLTAAPVVDLVNATAYLSYRLVFDGLKENADGALMQIADVQFFTEPAAAGSPVMTLGDPIIAIDFDVSSQSSYPDGEAPSNAIDGSLAKYLNFAGAGSGFVVTPSVGASILEGFTLTTANDAEGRDPATYTIYGTNDPITSVDNSTGSEEDWVVIQSGGVFLPADRDTVGEAVDVTNSSAYTSYRVVFDTLKDNAGLMQIGEMEFEGRVGTGVELQFTRVSHDMTEDEMSLVWRSEPNTNYRVEYSLDLITWFEENDSVDSEGALTSYVPADADLNGLSRVYFRVSVF